MADGVRREGIKLANTGIEMAMAEHAIEITEFVPENLKLHHYRLRPGQLFRPVEQGPDGSYRREFICNLSELEYYEFRPHEYLIVTSLEQVYFGDGISAERVSASTLTDQCFGLTAGKQDPGYGRVGGGRQDFVMGLFNFLPIANRFYTHAGVANISFYDSRDAPRRDFEWTRAEQRELGDRDLRRLRAVDDGPDYTQDDW
jgi:hypothetical protein